MAEITVAIEYPNKGYGKQIARYDLSEYDNQIRVKTIDEFLEHLLNDIPFVSLQDEIECRKVFIEIAEKLKEHK